MVFERLQALNAYFDQLKGSPEYGRLVEKQCVDIVNAVKDLGELKLENATPLLALVQQSSHWTDDHKKTLVQGIHAKVEETMNGKVLKDRFPMQDYTLFPLYLTRNDWHVLLNRDFNVAQKCQVVMNRLFRLGVRCPSEFTYAMVTAVILLIEPERFSDPLQLRSSYLTVKGICKTILTSKVKDIEGPPSSIQKALPPVRTALPQDLLQAAYGDSNEEPMDPLPENISIEGLKQLESLVSCRGNNKKLQLQFRKACGVPMVNQAMGFGWNPYAPPPQYGYPGLFDCLMECYN